MKTRQGFVSNSSSTSFIIRQSDLEEMHDHHVQVWKISDLITMLSNMVASYRSVFKEYTEENTPYFLVESVVGDNHIWNIISYLEQLQVIEDKGANRYITEPYDRDAAYNNNWDFPSFETDL